MSATIAPARFIPTGAVKVADKLSDAVAYFYTSPGGRPAAVAYQGKAAKPVFWYNFASEEARERKVRAFFQGRRAVLAYRAERRERAKKPHDLKVGDILVGSWGYEQTNVDWFEVSAVVSAHMVEIRPIFCNTEDTGSMSGRCTPRAGDYKGEPMRRMVRNGSVKINESVRVSLWDGRAMYWSSYH